MLQLAMTALQVEAEHPLATMVAIPVARRFIQLTAILVTLVVLQAMFMVALAAGVLALQALETMVPHLELVAMVWLVT